MAEGGEFIIKRKTAEMIGHHRLKEINDNPEKYGIQKRATGGAVVSQRNDWEKTSSHKEAQPMGQADDPNVVRFSGRTPEEAKSYSKSALEQMNIKGLPTQTKEFFSAGHMPGQILEEVERKALEGTTLDGDTLGNTIVQHFGVNSKDSPTVGGMIVQKGKQNWTNLTLDNSKDPSAQINRKRRDLFFGFVSYVQDVIKSRTEALEEFARKKANVIKEGWVKAGTAVAMAGLEGYVDGLPEGSGFKTFMQSSAGNAATASVFAGGTTAIMGGSGKEIAAASAMAGVGAFASAEMTRMGAGDQAEQEMANLSADELEEMSNQAVDGRKITITDDRRAAMKNRVKWLRQKEADRGHELTSMRAAQRLMKAQKESGGRNIEGWDAAFVAQQQKAVNKANDDWRAFRVKSVTDHGNLFFPEGAQVDLTKTSNAMPKNLRPGHKSSPMEYNRSEDNKIFRGNVTRMKQLLKENKAAENWKQLQEQMMKGRDNKQMGGLIGFQSGGSTNKMGPDRRPVMMAPGEFVVNRESAQGMLPYLSRLNRYGAAAMGPNSMGHGGRIPGMQGGGVVGGGAAGGESLGGVNIPNNEGLTDAIMQLVDIAQGIRDSVDTSDEKAEETKQGGAAERDAAATTGGATNNISVTVNIERGGGEGETDIETSRSGGEEEEGEDSGDDPQKNEKFAEMLKASVIQVITEQQRPGGLLAD
jgi:hypothetical protein